MYVGPRTGRHGKRSNESKVLRISELGTQRKKRGEIMALPEKCKSCTHYDNGRCCHPEPFGVLDIFEGNDCESFDQNYDMD